MRSVGYEGTIYGFTAARGATHDLWLSRRPWSHGSVSLHKVMASWASMKPSKSAPHPSHRYWINNVCVWHHISNSFYSYAFSFKYVSVEYDWAMSICLYSICSSRWNLNHFMKSGWFWRCSGRWVWDCWCHMSYKAENNYRFDASNWVMIYIIVNALPFR